MGPLGLSVLRRRNDPRATMSSAQYGYKMKIWLLQISKRHPNKVKGVRAIPTKLRRVVYEYVEVVEKKEYDQLKEKLNASVQTSKR